MVYDNVIAVGGSSLQSRMGYICYRVLPAMSLIPRSLYIIDVEFGTGVSKTVLAIDELNDRLVGVK